MFDLRDDWTLEFHSSPITLHTLVWNGRTLYIYDANGQQIMAMSSTRRRWWQFRRKQVAALLPVPGAELQVFNLWKDDDD